jgi:hypothetical protein
VRTRQAASAGPAGRKLFRGAVPPSYRLSAVGGAVVIALPEVLEFVCQAVEGAGSLYAYAAAHPEAVGLEGRGVAYAVPAPGGRWVVRHARRGGALARWLGDRYLRLGRPRPVKELAVSAAARGLGVETPEVVAAVVYPAGIFYRSDIASRFVPESMDLATALFGPKALVGEDRVLAAAAAGRLVRAAHECGVVHPDLNLKNVLLQWTMRPPRAYLLDLDRCRVVPRLSARRREAMLRRFWRSWRKWEARTGVRLVGGEREAFERAYGGFDG